MSEKIVTWTPEEIAAWIADGLRFCTDEQRATIFESLSDYYCDRCGREQGPKLMRCQCWVEQEPPA